MTDDQGQPWRDALGQVLPGVHYHPASPDASVERARELMGIIRLTEPVTLEELFEDDDEGPSDDSAPVRQGTMKEIVATLTPRGQVTVPPEVQQLLGVQPNGKITFRIEDGQVRLVPAIFTLETAYQSVPPLAEPLSDEEMTRIAKEERAERFARRLREP